MLLSQSLLEHRSFALDRYNIPRLTPEYHDHTWQNGHIHQLELVEDRFYYYMPPGSSVLSVPYVALANLFGVSARNADGTYNPQGEEQIETSLAALLMAALAVVFFLTARLLLPISWSLVIVLGAALGTQIWSTSSRALWADTWGILLLGIVVYQLLAHELAERKLNPVLLATLLSWMYFVRPTNAIMIIGISAYILAAHRNIFSRYALTGAAWLAVFVVYAWTHYHSVLPTYFRLNSRMGFAYFWAALAGNLISPSRGLFVYVPMLLFVAYLLIAYRKIVEPRALLYLSLFVASLFLVAISGFDPWWAGASYGPRYMAPLIPWFVLLAVLGVSARLKSIALPGKSTARRKIELLFGSVLLMLSVSINAIGAISNAAWLWNARGDIDHDPWKVWDFRYPQMLAPFIHPPLPAEFALADSKIDLSSPDSERFLGYGWSGPEKEFRWTDGPKAAIIFATKEGNGSDIRMRISLIPFLVPGRHILQRVDFVLNDQAIKHLELRDDKESVYEVTLPREFLTTKNVLLLNLPDAAAPSDFNINSDQRRLALAVRWIDLSNAGQP